jgi:hypothetical protein
MFIIIIIIVIIIITITIIIIISFMQAIYTYIPGTNYVPREYTVAAIPLLLFMVLISLVSVLNIFYFYSVESIYFIIIIIIIIIISITIIIYSFSSLDVSIKPHSKGRTLFTKFFNKLQQTVCCTYCTIHLSIK